MTLQLVVHSSVLDDGVSLDVMGPTDLSDGAELSLLFNHGGGATKAGRVGRIEDNGACAIIEVDSKSWWLHRRDVMRIGPAICYHWAIGGRES